MKVYHILSLLFSLFAAIGWVMSMKWYFKIRAYKVNRKEENIFIEHSNIDYVFDTDFIEYFPFTYILHKIDNTAYNKYDESLKKMYQNKAKYEFLFGVSFFLIFVFVFLETGGVITSAY